MAEERKNDRRARHDREIEENQAALRKSISETERLVGESEKMLRRHKQERDGPDDNGAR